MTGHISADNAPSFSLTSPEQYVLRRGKEALSIITRHSGVGNQSSVSGQVVGISWRLGIGRYMGEITPFPRTSRLIDLQTSTCKHEHPYE